MSAAQNIMISTVPLDLNAVRSTVKDCAFIITYIGNCPPLKKGVMLINFVVEAGFFPPLYFVYFK